MKHPEDCHSLNEIRWEIDQLDRDIIKKFGIRFDYVKAAAKFKTSKATVQASERFHSMLQQRRIWAEEAGLNPDVIEQLYRDLYYPVQNSGNPKFCFILGFTLP